VGAGVGEGVGAIVGHPSTPRLVNVYKGFAGNVV
jgi:hypothetical protein